MRGTRADGRRPERGARAKGGDLRRAGSRVLVGVVAPVALYYGLRWAGVGAYPALIAGVVVPALGAAVGLARDRRIDHLMAYFSAMTLLSLGVSLAFGGPRFLLAREGWITGAAGVWFLVSAPTARPLALAFSRPLLEGILRYGVGRWEDLWDREPGFRRVWRVTSAIFGVGLLADAAARIAMAYALPIDLVPALGVALYAAATVAMLAIVNVYQARSGLWLMLLRGSDTLPSNPTARRLLHPIHRSPSREASASRPTGPKAETDETAERGKTARGLGGTGLSFRAARSRPPSLRRQA